MSQFNISSLSEFADATLPRLMKKSQATGGSILLAHNEMLMVHADHGLKEERGHNARIPIGVGVTGQAAQSGDVQWVPDVDKRDNYIEGVNDAEWEFVVPIMNDGQKPSLIIDFESDHDTRPDQQTRDAIVRYLTVRRDLLLGLAEKACYWRLSRMDALSSLMHGDSFKRAIRPHTPGGLFVMDLEPRLDTATVSAFNELKVALRQVGEQLSALLSNEAFIGRFYDTTFGAFLPDIAPDSMDRKEQTLRQKLAETCSVKHVNSVYVKKRSEVQMAIDETFVNRTYSDSEQADKRMVLNEVLNKGNIELYYQPIKHVRFKRNVGHEILVRGPEGSLLRSLKDLFRTAYNNGRIVELDQLIARTALKEYPADSNRTIFLNVERRSINSSDWREAFVEGVRALPDGTTVCVEVTEHDDLSELQTPIHSLRDKLNSSVLFAIDDFGTGSSNFRSVLNLSPDVVKLDRSLISHLDENFEKRSLVESVLSFSAQADIDVVAEGIERQKEWETVRELGAELAQGHYFARPESLQELGYCKTGSPARDPIE